MAHRVHWRKHHRIMAGVLIAVILIGGGLLMAQDKETLQLRSPLSADDPRFPDYLARLVGHPLTHGDAYQVHTDAHDAFPAMLATIDHARERVCFETYNYESGKAGEQFTTAFAAAAQRGVRVRLVLDAIGSKKLGRESIERLKSAGVSIGWINPLLGATIQHANYRTHRKALVVDGVVAFVGGMGVADQWLLDRNNVPPWRDTQVELRGPVVSDIEAAFNQNWILIGGIVEPEVAPTGPEPAGTGESIVVWSSRQGGVNELKLLDLLAIAAARHRVDIESPYLITDESSKWVIRDARQRGVRIRMLVDGDITDAIPVKYASRADYEALLQQGVEIAEYQPTMMHAKVAIIDDDLSIVGSANFDNRSLEMNDELNVAIFDRELAGRLRADFDRDLTRSKILRLDRWRARPLTKKTRDWLFSYFGEVF